MGIVKKRKGEVGFKSIFSRKCRENAKKKTTEGDSSMISNKTNPNPAAFISVANICATFIDSGTW